MIQNYKNLSQLNEVKKDQIGTGLLIENDGHIISHCDTVSQIKEDVNTGRKFVIPDKFILPALFQKYNVKNANNRIYPESILRRQVDKYIEDRVNKHCAIGALDHPQCQLANTRILTKYGWKNITEIEENEEIQTLNTSTKVIETHKVLKKIESPYDGEIYHLQSNLIDLEVTPNHKFPIFGQDHEFKGFFTAEQIYNHEVPDQNNSYIPKTATWIGTNDEYFELPQLDNDTIASIQQNKLKEKYSTPLQIPMNVWMKFMAVYLSGGYTVGSDTVRICQDEKQIGDEIENMLNDFPLNHTITDRGNGNVMFNIFDLRLCNYLKQFGDCYRKYIPYSIKKQNKEMLKIFYDWFIMSESSKRGFDDDKKYSFSTSKRMVMDLNEIQLKIGYCGKYHEEDKYYDRLIKRHTINGESTHDMYSTMESHNNAIWLQEKSLTITKNKYNGMVYCVEVENHNFYTMDKSGFCLWSGNSSSLSGHDVAMNILNLYWKGQTLLGELELVLSEGFRRMGVCSTSGDLAATYILNGIQLGVSSRGVGSVKNEGGVLMVDDDYEIICWDVVCEPSTPNAWIKNSVEELMPFVESTQKNDMPLNEKIKRLEKILL